LFSTDLTVQETYDSLAEARVAIAALTEERDRFRAVVVEARDVVANYATPGYKRLTFIQGLRAALATLDAATEAEDDEV